MSAFWYNFYLPLVLSGQMNLEQLQAALAKGRITQSEFDDLVSKIPAP
jgi:hypothetical protein